MNLAIESFKQMYQKHGLINSIRDSFSGYCGKGLTVCDLHLSEEIGIVIAVIKILDKYKYA